jgi:nucleotide-binding universal stress UspA family protein
MDTTSTPFSRILVPTDGTAAGATAVEVARRLAERAGATLVLLRVESEHALLDGVLADTAALTQQTSDLRDEGIPAQYRVDFGRPAVGIAVAASEEGADLIVLAHEQRTFLQRLHHPSVTARLFSRAPALLLIWPEQQPAAAADDLLACPGAVVLVPLDGSDEAERALPLAVQFARRYDRILLLARVVAPLPLAGATSPYYVPAPIPVEAPTRDEHEASEYLSATRQRLAAETGLTMQSLLLDGDPASAIAAAVTAHEGSLIVMTTHGRTGLSRLVVGSVAVRLIDCTPVPLLVVPPLLTERAPATVPEQTAEHRAEADRKRRLVPAV